MAPRRTTAGEALVRPAMAPTAPVDGKATVRITVDLPREVHRLLREWALDATLDASVLVLGLLGLAEDDAAVRVRAEEAARGIVRARRAAAEARR
jgi:hypothetical protein